MNVGFGKELSLAYANELSRREIRLGSKHKMSVSSCPETALISICSQECLISLINWSSLAVRLILIPPEEKKKCTRLRFDRKGDIYSKMREYETPLITLLFQGEPLHIHLVLGLIKSRLPVVIIEESGGLADILAFAYHQINCRPENSNFAEFTEIVLKPLLCNKINQFYPNMSTFNISERSLCEKIFDCFRHFRQQEQVFVTVLTLQDLENESVDLPSHLLLSLFKSLESETIKNSFQIKNDLHLAMDWNSPKVAYTDIFAKDPTNKFHIDNETFTELFTKPNREEFVLIFS
ncbi:transient receptor potential cation channel subfamily M member 2 [Caerostris extrusa]|uniref:Transient receptor potential cation channel subfamily M member 2 n=1 Tax=Caerostris extrusa TaxID=172846 RepID=A0AAV4V764_CAEEX|nr:transient receptor potential cation channel subfamily M member 2 [Caerostris extrusa]